VVNLADHRVVDLLPDRSAATVAGWLAAPPTLTVGCRERSDLYAEGMRRGAPDAAQVIDRFPLVHHLRQAREAFPLHHRPALQAAAVGPAMALTPADGPVPVTPMYRERRRHPKLARAGEETSRLPRHALWVTIYEAVYPLQVQGIPEATIARQLGISLPTVHAYLRRKAPPGPTRPQFRWSTHVLTP
jgi:transposase